MPFRSSVPWHDVAVFGGSLDCSFGTPARAKATLAWLQRLAAPENARALACMKRRAQAEFREHLSYTRPGVVTALLRELSHPYRLPLDAEPPPSWSKAWMPPPWERPDDSPADSTPADGSSSDDSLTPTPAVRVPKLKRATSTLGVLAIFQNEAHAMREWVAHYRAEGVSQFVLIDNGSTDDGAEIARSLSTGDITVVSFPGQFLPNKAFRAHYGKLRTEWMLVADLDDFAFHADPTKTIPDYLDSITESGCSAVILPQTQFGTWFNRHPSTIIKGNRMREPSGRRNATIRTISRISELCDASSSVHAKHARVKGSTCTSRAEPWGEPYSGTMCGASRQNEEWLVHDGMVPSSEEQLRMNHYPLQSWEYFKRIKMRRGAGHDNHVRASPWFKETRNQAYFDRLNARQERDEALFLKRGQAFIDELSQAPQPRWPSGDDAPRASSHHRLMEWLNADRPASVRAPERLVTTLDRPQSVTS